MLTEENKVSLLINRLGGGGAERVATEISNYSNSKIDLNIVMLGYKISYDINKIPHSLDINAYKKKKTTPIGKIMTIIEGSWKYFIYLKENKISLSVSMLEPSNMINIIASSLAKTKCIISIRTNPFGDATSKIEKLYNRVLLHLAKKKTNKIILNSYSLRQELVDMNLCHENNTIVIYNPKNIEDICRKSGEEVDNIEIDENKYLLVNASRLEESKGHKHLLRIFQHILRTHPSRLLICGVGSLEEELKDFARKLKIENDVVFLGWCDNPYKYFSKADVFVYSSLLDSQPNALIEALICGCPIVSNDCDFGPREILDDGKYGLLSLKLEDKPLSPEDPLTDAERDFKEKVILLLDNPNLRKDFSKISEERLNIFDREKLVNDYLECIYDTLLHP